MAHSYDSLLAHIVFSTKNRQPWLKASFRSELFARLGRIAKDHGQVPLAVGGVADHVHLLLGMSRTAAPCDIVKALKVETSQWVAKTGRVWKFGWQTGYGIFSVSKSRLEAVRDYIRRQEDHHAKRGFQDEFRKMLEQHEIAYKEAQVWD